ncbi:unnamed protein product [Gongylonema pulchrum]|uniref:Uncharacterized protein n=1 Tax=Gongylonema pulchrum TaxID=637853 RepID=A0A3P7NZF3_9BILA|nr:unnamed protein product [Gongylonema pulchrum]
MDETQFSNPKSFDYDFEDDLRKPADTNDIYDELVPYLPTFVLHKNGKDVGRTSVSFWNLLMIRADTFEIIRMELYEPLVPIITRKMPAWSTPPPKQKYVEPYRPFSPRPLDGFRPRPGLTGLTALVDQK